MRASWIDIASVIVAVAAVLGLTAAVGRLASWLADAAGAGLVRLLRWAARRFDLPIEISRGAEQPAPDPRAGWSVSLIVDADEASGEVRPTVIVHAPSAATEKPPVGGMVRLRLIDAAGAVRADLEARYAWDGPDTGVALELFKVADPRHLDAVARWNWFVRLSDAEGELARMSGPLAAAGRVNDEGELHAPDAA